MKEGVEEKTSRGRKGKMASLTKKIKEAVGKRNDCKKQGTFSGSTLATYSEKRTRWIVCYKQMLKGKQSGSEGFGSASHLIFLG